MKTRNAFFIILVGAVLAVPLRSAAQEADPDILITWRAQSYAPSDYAGRVLPGLGSSVIASAEFLANGGIVDVSRETIYWYLNDKFLRGGVGLQTVAFRASTIPGAVEKLRVQINGYKKQNRIILKTVAIPVAEPEAVIEAPFPENKFSSLTVSVHARPYFFNVRSPSELSFLWTVNGEKPAASDNPSVLTVNLAEAPKPGSSVEIGLEVGRGASIFEAASGLLRLTFNQ